MRDEVYDRNRRDASAYGKSQDLTSLPADALASNLIDRGKPARSLPKR